MSSEQVTCDVAHFHKRGGGLARSPTSLLILVPRLTFELKTDGGEHKSKQSTETCLTTNNYIAFEESGLN